MGRAPTTKRKVRELTRMTLAVRYLIEGWPITDIARELNVTPRQVRSYQSKVLALQSVYSESQTVANRDQLRTLEAERLNKVWAAGVVTLDIIKTRVGSENEKSLDGSSVARLVDGLTKTSERLSRLLGLDVPAKVVTETFSMSIKKIDSRVTVHFDPAQLKPSWTDVGLRRVPGDDQTPTTPLFEATGNVTIADQPENAPINDPGAFCLNGNGNGSDHST